ncbi:MAG: glycosyltransferase 87 family protein [Proteobacteria bacterium]|nr:glycosyltransferase 87 family protein [Pseudomonadota bacterium]
MSGRGARIVAAALFACLAGLLAALAAASHGSPSPVWRLVAIAIVAHAPYAALIAIAARGREEPGAIVVICAAAALRLVLVFGSPVFSDDVYRYAWDGRVVAAGLDPYARPPSDEALAAFRDEGFARINNPELRTIYPPFAQLAFGAIASISPAVTAFRVAAALADLGVVFLVMTIARRIARSDRRAAGLAGIAYGLNPLACIETAMSGHLEPLAVLPVAGAFALLLGADVPARAAAARRIAAGAALAVACCTKLVPLLIVVPLVRRLRAAALIVPLALVAGYAAFWSPDLGAVRTLDTFARRWEGNAGGFALIKSASEGIIGAATGAGRPDEIVHVRFLDRPAAALQGGFFSLHKDGELDPSRPGAFTLSDLALAAAKIIAAALLVGVVVWVCRRRAAPPISALWVFGAFLLLTPVLHPWYLLWILPWAACLRAWPWLAFGAALPLAYLPLDSWWAAGTWDAPAWIPAVEHGVLCAAGLASLLVRERRRRALLTGKGDRSRNPQ